jgi:hypothetical protein
VFSLCRRLLQAQEIKVVHPTRLLLIFFLGGGPPHQDMWDIKDRSSFRDYEVHLNRSRPMWRECTSENAFLRSQLMFDKFTAIRSVVGSDGSHDGHQCVTGWSRKDMVSGTSYPAIGSCASKILGVC